MLRRYYLFLAILIFILLSLELVFQQVLKQWLPVFWLDLGLSLGVALLLVLLTWLFVNLSMKRYIARIQQMSEGGADVEKLLQRDDAIGDLARLIQEMATKLNRQMAKSLKRRSRLEAVFSSMVEGVVGLDPNGRIQIMNPALRNMMAVTDNPVGKDVMEVLRNVEIKQLAERVCGQESTESQVISFMLDDEKYFQVNATPIMSKNEHFGAVMIFHDITRITRLEKIRQEFVANVSHELRTPIASIKGFAETLLDQALEDPETAREFVGIIYKDADRLSALVNDILELARIESGRLTIEIHPFDLKPLVQDVFDSMKGNRKNVALILDVPDNLIPVNGDANRISQVLVNLVDNAIKYNREDGAVTVQARQSGAHVVITISDTGIGIPADVLPRVFERFFRVDKARSRSLGGTGLGLSIVKHIVQAHQGEVDVTSIPDRGTTFTLTLPGVAP